MAGRTSGGRISEADFSSLLDALTANPKGRAFLDELRRRSRPDDTLSLLESLHRIEATIGSVRDQLQPERIADELRHVAMTLEIAIEGAPADAAGDEHARRLALVERGRSELATLAASLSGAAEPPLAERTVEPGSATSGAELLALADDLSLLDQFAASGADRSPDR